MSCAYVGILYWYKHFKTNQISPARNDPFKRKTNLERLENQPTNKTKTTHDWKQVTREDQSDSNETFKLTGKETSGNANEHSDVNSILVLDKESRFLNNSLGHEPVHTSKVIFETPGLIPNI